MLKNTAFAVVGMVAFAGCFCIDITTPTVMRLLDNGTGYTVEGSYNFEGTLTYSNGRWNLAGSFVFNTGGYAVAEPDIIIMESFPEQVIVTLTVTPPPPGAIVTQVITEVPVAAQFDVSEEAEIAVFVRTQCPSPI